MTEEKFTTKDVTEAKTGRTVYANSYWLCVDGDPTKAIFYGSSPQCNKDKRILEWCMRSKIASEYPANTKITFIKTAFVPQRS